MNKDNILINFRDDFELICTLFKNNKIPNSIIIDGKEGIGKHTFAKHLINYIFSFNDINSYNTKKFEINILSKSYKLILNNSHPNLYTINLNENKNSISVEQIRDMIKYANKSSFDNKYKIILINKSEYLNKSSSNALLKILEEPSDNTIFLILQNSENKNLKTIQSRCIKFNLRLDFKRVIETVNLILDDDINNLITKDLISYYNSPGQIISLLNFAKNLDINIYNTSIADFIKIIIDKKLYLKDSFMKKSFNSFLERYLLNITMINKELKNFNYYDLFIKNSNNAKIYNMDLETIYLNYKQKVFNE
mgnify:CR=1 FL=1